ncbi:MAG: short-chain dehydrogenase, partial [Pyrinomonadaceae bacterium]|nr:short-chain dehydrogenase [Pyrinomonadaceae bacterium]
EMTVGLPAVVAIYGNKVLPALGDWYLGKYGYESQQTDERVDPNRPNNLYEPVAGDHGAHGIFDNRSYSFSPQAWANMNRGIVLIAGAGLALVACAALVASQAMKLKSRLPDSVI